jgi:Ca-activated chloride channel family protein
MEFSAPGFLWLLLLIPPALLLGLLTERFSGRVRAAFAVPASARQRWRMSGRILLACLAILSLVAAMAGPRIRALRRGDIRRSLVLVVGLDVSKSMLAEDAPLDQSPQEVPMLANRLNAASRFANQLFEELAGESAGLFFFARNGIEVVTPTRDQGFLSYMVRHTSMADLTESGSSLAAAMKTGAEMVTSRQDGRAGAIVLISDGEDTENSLADLMKKAEELDRRKIPVFTVAIGRPKEVFIPIRREGLPGIQGFFTDARGSYLKTRLQERPLREIAAATGGEFFSLDETTARHLSRELLDRIARSVAENETTLPRELRLLELAPLFLAFGLVSYAGFLLL